MILDDPYDDPPGLQVPDRSPEPTKEQLDVSLIDFKTLIVPPSLASDLFQGSKFNVILQYSWKSRF